MSNERTVWGTGLTTIAADGTVLDAWYPHVGAGVLPDERTLTDAEAESLDAFAGTDERRNVTIETVALQIDLDAAPASTADAYLRLHALSHLLVRPNELNLDGIFGHLPNVAWTNAGPMHPADAARLQPQMRRHGIQVQGLDKFPRLTDYVQPEGVRIADA